VAVALTVTAPDTVDPSAGDEISALGLVVSAVLPPHPVHPDCPITNKPSITRSANSLEYFFISITTSKKV
jgi:hypothetical protein